MSGRPWTSWSRCARTANHSGGLRSLTNSTWCVWLVHLWLPEKEATGTDEGLWHFFGLVFLWSSADRLSKEGLIKKQLRDIMSHADLGNLTSRMERPNTRRCRAEPDGFCGRVWLSFALPLQVLDSLTSRVDFDLKPYKKYIDNEILVTLAQMDRPSKIFDYLYLVGDSLTFKNQMNHTKERS